MEKIDVLYTTDEKFIDIMLASAISLIENSNISTINIHIITADFSSESFRKIAKKFNQYNNVNYEFYPLEVFDIEKFNVPSWRGTQIANARLFFQEIMKDNLPLIDNLLYLDSDTIIVDELSDLKNYQNNSISAVKDLMRKSDIKSLALPIYYNSGVLYINVNDWMKKSYQDKLIRNIEASNDKLQLPDQDLLNLTLWKEINELPAEYNVAPVEYTFGPIANKLYFNSKIRQVTTSEIISARNNPKILHAYGYGNIKPWTKNNINPYNEEFERYLLMANPNFTKKEVENFFKIFAYQPLLMKSLIFTKSFLPTKINQGITKVKRKLEI